MGKTKSTKDHKRRLASYKKKRKQEKNIFDHIIEFKSVYIYNLKWEHKHNDANCKCGKHIW